MVRTEYESSTYQQPRETKYVIDFGKIFETEGSDKKMAALLADYISATNLRPDVVLKPHLARENPESHQKEYPLVEKLGEILNIPTATLYEYNDKPDILVGNQPRTGQNVVIVDGAVRTGGTILRTADHLRKLDSDIVIHDAVVYMVRPEGRKLEALKQRLANEGIRLHALITASDLIRRLFLSGYLSEAQLEEAMGDEDFH